ncbi:MAG: VCBS repeat-containing protein [Deltaproteobacteria bacterium]|nr:VCBS repeat-containing protein [Deltaproteobacteria bacterium]
MGCHDGFDDCNGGASDGCETDLTTEAHCGTCDTACAPTYRFASMACELCPLALAGAEGVPLGKAHYALAVADLDGDGDRDLATTAFIGGGLAVSLNAGNGTFGPVTTYLASTSLASVVAGDFDQDADVDLAVVGDAFLGPSDLTLLLNAGNGTFKTSIPLGTSLTGLLAVGDVNGDARPDLLGFDHGLTDVKALLGTGTACFTPEAADYADDKYPFFCGLEVADLDKDGRADFVLLLSDSKTPGNRVLKFYRRNKANNGFDFLTERVFSGADLAGLTLRDFDGDGASDTAIVDKVASRLLVYMNKGGG